MAQEYKLPASAELAARGIAGGEALAKIDDFVGQRRPSDQIDPRIVSRATGVPGDDVEEALEAYTELGVLARERVLECSFCQATASAEDVEEARLNKDNYPCPGACEHDLAADQDAAELVAYTPIEEPPG